MFKISGHVGDIEFTAEFIHHMEQFNIFHAIVFI